MTEPFDKLRVAPKRPLKVFLCHAHSDRDAVKALYARLTKDGIDAWLDKEKLLPGQDWELEIRKAVREADVVVVCLSKQFNQAGFRQKEVRLALDTAMEQPEGEIFIMPLRLEVCDAPESLRHLHWVDLFEEIGYEMLMRALRGRADKIGAILQIKKNLLPKVISLFKSEESVEPQKGTTELEKVRPMESNSSRKPHTAIILTLVALAGIIVVGLLSGNWLSLPINAPIVAQPECVSSTTEPNPYLSHSQSNAVIIYENYKLGSISYAAARQNALSELGKSAERWSDHLNVAIDDFQMVRITITYIDPKLVQYIVLNQVLLSSNSMDAPTFDSELGIVMNTLATRNELLFVVTITSPFYREQAYNNNVLTVRMPIEQMALVSSGDIRVTPTHEDPKLDENIDITHGPVSGVVGYPVSVIVHDLCTYVIDSWTRRITLDIPSVMLGVTQIGAQFWSIPYKPLIGFNLYNPFTVPPYDPNYDWTRIQWLAEPPKPNWKPNALIDDTNWTVYWEDMGRYLWYFLLNE